MCSTRSASPLEVEVCRELSVSLPSNVDKLRCSERRGQPDAIDPLPLCTMTRLKVHISGQSPDAVGTYSHNKTIQALPLYNHNDVAVHQHACRGIFGSLVNSAFAHLANCQIRLTYRLH